MDASKRTWLIAAGCAGCVGAISLAAPLVSSLGPSELAKAEGGPVEADISDVKPGEKKIVAWRGKPVWILNRTPAMMESLKNTKKSELADPDSLRTNYATTPDYARNDNRARQDTPNILVMVGICTHLGCSPTDRFAAGAQTGLPDNWPGGFLCPCHGSRYDMSGRVYKSQPAPDNLAVPPYQFLTATRLLIGDDTKKA